MTCHAMLILHSYPGYILHTRVYADVKKVPASCQTLQLLTHLSLDDGKFSIAQHAGV